jgi:hypothetical protein
MLAFDMKLAARPYQFSNPSRTSSFSHQPIFNVPTNPFRLIALHTLSSDGKSLAISFQQLAHSFLSHGTGPSTPSIFELRFSNLSRSLSPFFATLTNSASCNPFICHSYENTGGGTHLFPLWNSLRPCFLSLSALPFPSLRNAGTEGVARNVRSQPKREPLGSCAGSHLNGGFYGHRYHRD